MDHTIALIQRSHNGDEEARTQLVEENIGLIWCVVKRFLGRGIESEDLFQIGSIGLLKAIDKFDFAFQVKFSTYAVPMIAGEIQRFMRDDGMIKVSRSLKEMAYKAFRAKEEFQSRENREPTLEEISGVLGIEKEELVMAMEACVEVESIYRPVYQKDGKEVSLLEKLEESISQEEMVVDRMFLSQMLSELETTERRLIYLRYFESKTQAEIGKKLRISQVQVSRMEKKILQKMRDKYFL